MISRRLAISLMPLILVAGKQSVACPLLGDVGLTLTRLVHEAGDVMVLIHNDPHGAVLQRTSLQSELPTKPAFQNVMVIVTDRETDVEFASQYEVGLGPVALYFRNGAEVGRTIGLVDIASVQPMLLKQV